MTMVLGPDKKAQAAAEKRRQAETEDGAPADQPVTDAPDTTPVAEAPEATETTEAPAEVVEAPAEATDTTEA